METSGGPGGSWAAAAPPDAEARLPDTAVGRAVLEAATSSQSAAGALGAASAALAKWAIKVDPEPRQNVQDLLSFSRANGPKRVTQSGSLQLQPGQLARGSVAGSLSSKAGVSSAASLDHEASASVNPAALLLEAAELPEQHRPLLRVAADEQQPVQSDGAGSAAGAAEDAAGDSAQKAQLDGGTAQLSHFPSGMWFGDLRAAEAARALARSELLTAGILDKIYPGRKHSNAALGAVEALRAQPKRGKLERHASFQRVANTVSNASAVWTPFPARGGEVRSDMRRGAIFKSDSLGSAATEEEWRRGSSNIRSSGGGSGSASSSSSHRHLLAFRRQLLAEFATVSEAFGTFAKSIPIGQAVRPAEFCQVLREHRLTAVTPPQLRVIFEMLEQDHDRPGDQSKAFLNGLHMAVEAVAPVRTMKELRLRWLAAGFHSMPEALQELDPRGSATWKRLSLEEFGEALRRVHVHGSDEHAALFKAICTDADGRVSLGELSAAVAASSPALALEELRAALLRKYGDGHFAQAFQDMDSQAAGNLTSKEFVARAVRCFGIQEGLAKKVYSSLDPHAMGMISRADFITGMSLPEPQMPVEAVRAKVLQMFYSIMDAMARWIRDAGVEVGGVSPPVTALRLQDMLTPLGFTEAESKLLFRYCGGARRSAIGVPEMLVGLRGLAPGVVLEQVRSRCLRRCAHVNDAFAAARGKSEPLCARRFAQATADLDLLLPTAPDQVSVEGVVDPDLLARDGCPQAQVVFELLDARRSGAVSLNALAAALLSFGAGSGAKLSTDEREDRVRHDIHHEMAPLRQFASSVKAEIRQGRPRDYDESIPIDWSFGSVEALWRQQASGRREPGLAGYLSEPHLSSEPACLVRRHRRKPGRGGVGRQLPGGNAPQDPPQTPPHAPHPAGSLPAARELRRPASQSSVRKRVQPQHSAPSVALARSGSVTSLVAHPDSRVREPEGWQKADWKTTYKPGPFP